MMIGIKQVTETGNRGRFSNHVQVVLWAITFVVFIIAGVLVIRAKAWHRALVTMATAGILFQVLTLAQPPAAVSLTLVWMVLALLWWPSLHIGAVNRPVVVRTPRRDALRPPQHIERHPAPSRPSGV